MSIQRALETEARVVNFKLQWMLMTPPTSEQRLTWLAIFEQELATLQSIADSMRKEVP